MCVLKLRLKCVCVETAPEMCVLKLYFKCVETAPEICVEIVLKNVTPLEMESI